MTVSLSNLKTAFRTRLFKQWMIAATLSLMIQWALVSLTLYLLSAGVQYSPISQLVPSPLAVLYSANGSIVMRPILVLGLCQWPIIRHQFQSTKRTYGWLVATVLGAHLAIVLYGIFEFLLWHLGEALPNLYDWVPGQIIQVGPYALGVGLSVGFAQWLFFRGRVDNASRWIWAVVMSQAVGAVATLYFLGNSEFFSFDQTAYAPSLISILLSGVAQLLLRIAAEGAFTGWLLVRFVAQEKQKQLAYES